MTGSNHQECVQKENKPFDTELQCFLCLENIFKCDTLNVEVGGGLTSLGVSFGIKTLGGHGDGTPAIIPLQSICRYLGIDFQKILTGDGEKLSSDEMSADETFCNQCFNIVSPLSTLCNQLELLQMKVDYYLKSVVEVADRLSGDGKATKNSMDERNQRLAQLLRMEMSKKGKAKLNQVIPKVKLVKISSVQLGNNFLNVMPSSEKKIIADKTTVSALKLASDDTKITSPHVGKPKGGKSAHEDFKCNVCGKLFKFANDFYKHRKLGHDEEGKPNLLKCEICSKVFTLRTSLIRHKKIIHEGGKDNFKCDFCSCVFRWKDNLRSHVKVVHNKQETKLHVCKVCGKVFKYRSEFYRHRKLGHDEEGKPNVLKCEICGNVFITKVGLMAHKKVIHEGIRNYFKCGSCGKVFPHRSNFRKHVKMVHSEEGILQPHVFSVCGKAFSDAYKFSKHTKLGHNKEGKPNVIKCEICGKLFTTRQSLMRHKLVIHEGVKNNKCDLCGKVYPWRRSLSNHVKTVHNKVGALKLHVCNVCGRVFKSHQEFYKHRILGHDEEGKPNVIICEICGKVFTRRDSLTRHKEGIHEGAKLVQNKEKALKQRHVCSVCGNIFQYRRSLKRHFQQKHQETSAKEFLKCDSCGKVLSSLNSLQRHQKIMHQSHMSTGQGSKGVDFDKANLKSAESEPVVKVYVLPNFIEEQDFEHPVEGSNEGMHRDGSIDCNEMKDEDHFFPGVSSNSIDHYDDCHSEELQVEMKIVPD